MTDHKQTRANEVRAAARKVASWGRKAYISDVARELGYRSRAFHRGLLELHQAGYIVLSRADLSSALDLDKVAASETVLDLGFTRCEFHFVDGHEA